MPRVGKVALIEENVDGSLLFKFGEFAEIFVA